LEAAAYQAREVFDAIYKDSKVLLKNLKVDGGGTNNKLLMQFQADIINVPVVQPKIMETTAMGAAFCAGLAVGVWKDLQEIRDLWSVSATFSPTMTEAEREKNLAGWRKAISKSLDWVEGDEGDQFHDSCQDDFELMNNPLSPKSRKKAFGARDGEGASGGGYSTASLLLVTMVGFGAGVLLERSHRRK
jgi:hypothetical protein